MKNTTGRLLLIIIVSTAVNGKLAKQTVNYDREIKVYQFESVQVKEQGEIVFSKELGSWLVCLPVILTSKNEKNKLMPQK